MFFHLLLRGLKKKRNYQNTSHFPLGVGRTKPVKKIDSVCLFVIFQYLKESNIKTQTEHKRLVQFSVQILKIRIELKMFVYFVTIFIVCHVA